MAGQASRNCEGLVRQTPLRGSSQPPSRAAGRGPPAHHSRARACEWTGKSRSFHLRSVDRAEQGLDVIAHHFVERRGLGLMPPVDARCGAGFGWRGGSGRATPRCRLAGEPCLHYPRSLPAPSRRRGGIRRATSTLPSGMGTPGSSRERPRVSLGLAPSRVRSSWRNQRLDLLQALARKPDVVRMAFGALDEAQRLFGKRRSLRVCGSTIARSFTS